MARPTIRTDLILATQRRATMALIPLAANGTWRRAVDGAEEALGEPGEATWTQWPMSVFELKRRPRRGRYDEGGREARARQLFLVRLPEGVTADPAWEPIEGDDLVVDGVTWRVAALERQPVEAGKEYWQVEGERVEGT